jgi:protein subunit release factor B
MPISDNKIKSLEEKASRFGIHDSDIIERFIRSSGKGGQNVNKVATCVYLKHIPTNIEVKMQTSRSQAENRFLAKRLLIDKIEESILQKKSARQQLIEKIRRQKRKRSKRSKEKMLRNKHIQSEKKELRKRLNFDDS